MGALLAQVTGYRLTAALHRVIDVGIERFSSPFGLMPKYAAAIPADMLGGGVGGKKATNSVFVDSDDDEEEGEKPPIIYGEWIVEIMKDNAEWQGFKLPDRSKRHRTEDGQIVDGTVIVPETSEEVNSDRPPGGETRCTGDVVAQIYTET